MNHAGELIVYHLTPGYRGPPGPVGMPPRPPRPRLPDIPPPPEPGGQRPEILPHSREATPEPITMYYTPRAADPDFDYIPLQDKRPAVSEHDRKLAKAEGWKMIISFKDLGLEPEAYTKWTAKDGTVIYRKHPYQMDLGDRVGTIGNPTSVNIDGFQVCCNHDGGPPPCAEVHMVFEVSPHNKPHPKSWLRLPTTCLYEDASRAETLALRMEWKSDEGETKSEFLRYAHSPLLFDTAHEGQYDGLGIAIGILNHLENREIVQNKRTFVRDFGKARMLSVSRDWLSQLIELEDVSEPPQKIEDAGVRNQNAIHQELVAAGAENINLQFGTFRGTDERTRCDRCLVAHTIATGTAGSDGVKKLCSVVDCDAECELMLGTNQCTHCQHAGIDCTYTNDVLEKPALLRALWLAPFGNRETFSIVDPELATSVDNPQDIKD